MIEVTQEDYVPIVRARDVCVSVVFLIDFCSLIYRARSSTIFDCISMLDILLLLHVSLNNAVYFVCRSVDTLWFALTQIAEQILAISIYNITGVSNVYVFRGCLLYTSRCV